MKGGRPMTEKPKKDKKSTAKGCGCGCLAGKK